MRTVALLVLSAACACRPPSLVRAEAARPEPPEAPAALPATPPAELDPRPEGRLAHPICVGAVPPKERPHTATCCYPVKELLARPIRAAFPALRACYDARADKSAEGRVVFSFRIEQDGSIARACAVEGTSMEDEGAARCMLDVFRTVRYPATSDAERDLCGLVALTYPVVFAP